MRLVAIAVLLILTPSLLAAEDKLDFRRDVRPILSEYCFTCHGPDQEHREADLRLDVAEIAMANRAGVRAVVPGDLEASEMAYRISSDDDGEIMPPAEKKNPLSANQIEILRRWIREGAAYADHWAFVPPKKSELPKISAPHGNEVDAFILSRLKHEQLSPAQQAGPETLIRRVTLDLTGLPPSLEEIDAFLADDDPRSYEKLVDKLLTQERSAERLALEWMDVARYADTNGYSIDDHREMWAWRDWVIRAFRENMPYDTFVIEQLAGDLLPDATVNQKIASGFLRNAMNTHEGGAIAEEYRVASIADKIDTVATAFMGLTIKCAQCHDHKYDPITQKEYYQLFAFFNDSSEGGTGAKNGNTAPTLSLGKEWGGRQDVVAAYERRQADLTDFLGEMFAERRRAWEDGQTISETPAVVTARNRDAHEVFTTANASWVWAPDVSATDTLRVRHTFSLATIPNVAQLAVSCDNNAVVFINGQRIAKVDPWMKPLFKNVADKLHKGENTLRINARNAGGAAGLLAALVDDENKTILATTKAWNFSRIGSAVPELAKKGPMKELGAYGAAPWGYFESGNTLPDASSQIVGIAEPQRSYDQWQSLLKSFSATLDGADRTLLNRQLAAIKGERDLIEKSLQARDPSVMIMDSGSDRKTHVLVRGQYDQHGQVVTAGVPALLNLPNQGSVANRLELAKWLTDANHPLTSRVVVNRYWQMLMGTGIVKTTEDFGSQGEWPSHPELLDWLAVSFVEHNWDVRWLLKTIVLSSTYRQSSHFPDELQQPDPYNRLLARGSRFRLPAEAVRDNALQIAGLLSTKVGGPSVYPDQPDGLWRQVSHFGYPGFFSAQSFYPSVGADRYRRSMYTFWKRTAPPPALSAFDAPSREVCTVRRSTTNTPLQALVTLNEPQFMNAARALAERMVNRPGDRSEQIAFGFRCCTSRRPTAKELNILHAAFDRHYEHFRDNPRLAKSLTHSPSDDAKQLALQAAATMLASTLLNLDETLTRH